jgi:hypothetical protein
VKDLSLPALTNSREMYTTVGREGCLVVHAEDAVVRYVLLG